MCRAPECDCARRDDIPEGACAVEMMFDKPSITLSANDARFLAARLRKLFEHFNFPLPEFASDDARLIGIAGSAIGLMLTNAALRTAGAAGPLGDPEVMPVAWVNGEELRQKANATIACGAERRVVAGHDYDTPLYAASALTQPETGEAVVWESDVVIEVGEV